MPRSTEFEVFLEGRPESVIVNVDQRDYASYEGSDLYDPEGGHHATKLRYLAFSALRRSGQYSGGWKAFNEKDCIDADFSDAEVERATQRVMEAAAKEREGEQGEDPS